MQTPKSSWLRIAMVVGVSVVTLLALSLGVASLARANAVSPLFLVKSEPSALR